MSLSSKIWSADGYDGEGEITVHAHHSGGFLIQVCGNGTYAEVLIHQSSAASLISLLSAEMAALGPSTAHADDKRA